MNTISVIIDETVKSNSKQSCVNTKIKFFFETVKDSAKINQLVADPLKLLIARIDKTKNLNGSQKYIEESTIKGNEYIFSFYGASDKRNQK